MSVISDGRGTYWVAPALIATVPSATVNTAVVARVATDRKD